MAEEHQPKISGAAVAMGFIFLGTMDTIELIILFAGADDFGMSDIITFPVTQLYLRYKKARGTYSMVTQTIELIPYVGFMPLKSVGWGLVTWIDRHPEGTLAKALELIPKIKPSASPKVAPAGK